MATTTTMLRLYFVIPEEWKDKNTIHAQMTETYNACKAHQMKPKWLKESEGIALETTKTDLLVFHEFKGDFYNKAVNSRSVIIAPLCLLNCLKESIAIPEASVPLVSIALRKCQLSVTCISKEDKNDLQEKVLAMGGSFCNSFTTNTTHLIAGGVKSEKYTKAFMNGIPVVTIDFVNALWKESRTRAVHANDAEFSCYKCPVFYNLTICSTGFDGKHTIKDLVRQHGGFFSASMVVRTTDVLVCKSTASHKYKIAMKNKIVCVTEQWLHDSIAKGYALPNVEEYGLKIETSSPMKSLCSGPNFSLLSCISFQAAESSASSAVSFVEETQSSQIELPTTASKPDTSDDSDVGTLVGRLDIKKAKSAGLYLDGCVVYLCGFKQVEMDKLCKVLNYSGATRRDALNEQITHVIASGPSEECKSITERYSSCEIVNVQWLIDCMEQERPLDASNYAIYSVNNGTLRVDHDSPLSKKGLHLLRSTRLKDDRIHVEAVQKADENNADVQEHDADLVKRYKTSLQNNTSIDDSALAAFTFNPPMTTSTQLQAATTSDSTGISLTVSDVENESATTGRIFNKLKFAIVGFNREQEVGLIQEITELGGVLVPKSYKGIPDYAIVPIDGGNVPVTATHVVTDVWVTDCVSQQLLISELQYYHLPYSVAPNCEILQGLVITLTGLISPEKHYLSHLITHLGGKQQDSMARVPREADNVCVTTHLISVDVASRKFTAALKWGLPIVDKAWIQRCAAEGRWIDEGDFLVGPSREYFTRKQRTVHSPQIKTPISKKPASISDTPTTSRVMEAHENDENRCINTSQQEDNNAGTQASQMTPVNEIMARARQLCGIQSPGRALSQGDGESDISTPDTPYGRMIQDPPPPALRKEWKRWYNRVCAQLPKTPPRRDSTPLSEIKRRCFEQFLGKSEPRNLSEAMEVEEDANAPGPSKESSVTAAIDSEADANLIRKVNELEEHMRSFQPKQRRQLVRRIIEHPANTPTVPVFDSQDSMPKVGWDENKVVTKPPPPRPPTRVVTVQPTPPREKIFMISGLEASVRETITTKLEQLGATVSALGNYDPSSTHLVCGALNRNEKLLASMACGNWILHVSYVHDSHTAGRLLNEEDYEYGNAQKMNTFGVDQDHYQRAIAPRYWREEIARRGFGAFHDMRAIVVAQKKEPMIRVLEAGGAVIVHASPPFDENISATHCFLEVKGVNLNDYIPLAEQGIRCVNTVYVNDFLQRTAQDISNYIVPGFRKYY